MASIRSWITGAATAVSGMRRPTEAVFPVS
jgi:hypothetical protein